MTVRSGARAPEWIAGHEPDSVPHSPGVQPREAPPWLAAAREHWWASIPNRITALRLAALPGLWLLAELRETTWLGIGLGLAALTDVVDGILARRSGQTTRFGSRLDSVADHLMTGSTLLWLLRLRPEFFVRERLPLAAWTALGLLTLLVGWLRFRRIGAVHLYLAKVAGTLGYLFAVALLLFGTYSRWIFFVVLGVASLAALETLAIFLARDEVDEHVGSILRGARPPRESA